MDYFEVFDYGLFDTKFMIDKNRGAELEDFLISKLMLL